jgi:hypothetical protein
MQFSKVAMLGAVLVLALTASDAYACLFRGRCCRSVQPQPCTPYACAPKAASSTLFDQVQQLQIQVRDLQERVDQLEGPRTKRK